MAGAGMRKLYFGGVVMVMIIIGLMVNGGEGARMMMNMKEEKQATYRPQNFIAAGGFIPTTPGTPGFATGFGFGPSGFCSFPGSCVSGSGIGGSGAAGLGSPSLP